MLPCSHTADLWDHDWLWAHVGHPWHAVSPPQLSPEDGELWSLAGQCLQNSRWGDELSQGCTAGTPTWPSTDHKALRELESGLRKAIHHGGSKAHRPGNRDARTHWQAISLVWSWLSHSPFQMPVYWRTSWPSRSVFYTLQVVHHGTGCLVSGLKCHWLSGTRIPGVFGRWPSRGFGVPVSLLIPFWREFKWVGKDIWSVLIQCKWTLWWVNNFPFSFALLGYFNE